MRRYTPGTREQLLAEPVHRHAGTWNPGRVKRNGMPCSITDAPSGVGTCSGLHFRWFFSLLFGDGRLHDTLSQWDVGFYIEAVATNWRSLLELSRDSALYGDLEAHWN